LDIGPSRATAGPRKTFSWGPSGKKMFKYVFLKWCVLVYFIFWSNDGAPNIVGVWGNLPPCRRAYLDIVLAAAFVLDDE